MKIISSVLDGYRGFRLRQINHFEYRPTQKTQVILGTNGSGKSSLMGELSPLPANQTDFSKGGKKIITIQHRGKIYVLKSLFEADGNQFVFEVDGENLNPGLTVTVFKELVKQHFGYTPELHAVVTGKMKFSSMTVAERRNWFTKINDNDFTYAIKYHQRLKDAVRGLQGALKRNQEQLVQETEKCLTEQGEQKLRVTVSELTQILNTLLDHRKPKLSNPGHYQQQVARINESLESDLTRLERLLQLTDVVAAPVTIEALQQSSIALQVALQSINREIGERGVKLEKQQKDLDAVNLASHASLEEVQRTIRELEAEHTDLLSHLRFPVHFEDPAGAFSAFEAIRSSLAEIYIQLTQCPRLTYQKEDYQQLLQTMPGLNQTALKAKATEEAVFKHRQELELYKSKGAIDCPKCEHSWYLNYDDATYQKAVREHEHALRTLQAADKAVEEAGKQIAEHQHFYELLGRYNSLVSHFHVLAPYWAWSSEQLTVNPDSLHATIQSMSLDIHYQVKAGLLKERLKEHQQFEQLLLNTKQLDKNKLEKEIEDESQALLQAQRRSREAFVELEAVKNRIKILQQIDEYSRASHDALQERSMALKMLIEDSCISALDEMIRSVKLTLSQHERTLSQVDIQRAIVQNLSVQITEITAELKVLKLAQKALSPTEGLIARGMTGFINHFVKQMNEYIARIWLYPLEILPIKASDDDTLDLDYRFLVNVNDDDLPPVPDVGVCSTGMKEIIDLAFVAVSMKSLGLTDYPIFLDEFAKALDPAHRHSAYSAIEHLIESADYSQVFLVSHYQDGYSSLSAAEILVLCDSNVQMPMNLVYNQHATLN